MTTLLMYTTPEALLQAMPDNPYFLLTPGPLSTTKTVKAAMFRDWCTWDAEYNDIVQNVRARLVRLATAASGYTCALMQGSGTFSVESVIGSSVPEDGKLLVLANGHYGDRIATIAEKLRIPLVVKDLGERARVEPEHAVEALEADPSITHVAVVHCETTTGMLNPVEEIGKEVKSRGKVFFVDAMSSLGGVVMDQDQIGADFLVSSANKCVQGVPGFGFIVARREEMQKCKGRARSLSLDMWDQWREMEEKNGKWRYTSPTHVVRAFARALDELDAEGGPAARYARYSANQTKLVAGMREMGFETLLPDEWHSPIITSFFNPFHPDYEFMRFYRLLKDEGFVIYPGKVTGADTFRIGTIGNVTPDDVGGLLAAVKRCMYWQQA